MNIPMLLEMAAGAADDREAVRCGDEALTYAELHDRASVLAGRLSADGVENVALLALNSVDVPVLQFAAAAAGIPFVPLNYRLTDAQLDAALERLGSGLLVTDDGAGRELSLPAGVVSVPSAEVRAWSTDPTSPRCDGMDVSGDAVALKLFTSGTTGAPKTALIRHRHLSSYIVATVEFLGCGPEESILVSVPNYHIAGVTSVLSSTYSGRRMVQLPTFEPAQWVEVARAEAVTHAMVVPTMLNRILDELERAPGGLPHLRSLSYGGGRMPVPVLERALAALPGTSFVNAYGLTETSSTIAVLGPEDHRAALASSDPEVRARLGSVGRPLDSVEIEVRDVLGQPVPVGESGEIFVRGDQIAGEYASHSAVVDGWYPTRDRGRLDADGYLFLEGRADDVIVRGGENISPGEIEDVLLAHESVAEVAVVGVPDTEWGERVEAMAVASEGHVIDEAVLQEWVRRHLRSTRVPSRVIATAVLPYNETGKLLRREVKQSLRQEVVGA
ncbi:acyl-CoA synthetase (AMP-forming)/AMP-acid ligase II [Nocardioides zeae]|uniref:Acyl-CoA synthetase (AMP-forming)/AMP-acid ligase II n=2 Tax=Nocardioides zeae TaxID=1457234 RepID=A0ACC6IJ08_9ACTN|nr:AMP-binding protein [Nocardioides zeae]MDR6210736.1 acyl-CoA synthetase (AMP-forming)/AMP-acid ligase II [Nocardioides zeae]